MTTHRHTNGPWRLSGPDDFGDDTIQPPSEELAIAAVVNGAIRSLTGDRAEHQANARLIRAAPEMRAALVMLRDRLDALARQCDKTECDKTQGDDGPAAAPLASALAELCQLARAAADEP